MPVAGVYIGATYRNNDENDGELHTHHCGIERGAFANSDDKNGCDDGRDNQSGKIDDGTRGVERARCRIKIERSIREHERQLEAEDSDEILKVVRPAMRNGRGPNRVLQNQVPSHDPRQQLAKGCVGIRICGTGHRHHRCEFGITERRKNTGQPGNHEREHQRRPGLVVCGNAGQYEDAGTDNGADTQ